MRLERISLCDLPLDMRLVQHGVRLCDLQISALAAKALLSDSDRVCRARNLTGQCCLQLIMALLTWLCRCGSPLHTSLQKLMASHEHCFPAAISAATRRLQVCRLNLRQLTFGDATLG